jgi:hypothetical protein
MGIHRHVLSSSRSAALSRIAENSEINAELPYTFVRASAQRALRGARAYSRKHAG